MARMAYVKKEKPDIETLRFWYENNSVTTAASHFGVCNKTVLNWARSYGLNRKTWKHLNENIPSGFTPVQEEIIVGSLLGDGSLSKIKNGNSTFTENHGDNQREYIEWKFSQLSPFSSSLEEHYVTTPINSGNKIIGWTEEKCLKKHFMSTIAHPAFTSLEKLWYKRDEHEKYVLDHNKRRIKILPVELKITPLTLATWFYDDGCNQPLNRYALICTYGFSIEETERLVEMLRDLGFSCHSIPRPLGGKGRQIRINTSSHHDFIDMVSGWIPCPSMDYKIRQGK